MSRWRVGLALVALTSNALAGCTGATVGSGVGETRFEHAPYYASGGGASDAPPQYGGVVAVAGVSYQPGASQPAIFDPSADGGSPVASLVRDMNAYLETLARELDLVGPVPSPASGTAPDVYFGCEQDGLDECALDDEGGLYGPGRPRMLLTIGAPSATWVRDAGQTLADAEADALLLVTLEVGQYWPRQVDWRGSKVVELGTDRTAELPWLTAIDAPISVIQLTGGLVGPDGRARRIGAEGLLARRTPILAAGFGAQALITDADVEALRHQRSEDGTSLVWQDGLRSLVEALAAAGRR